MGRQEFHLDLDEAKRCADLYDSGQMSVPNKLAKMIWTAYECGYDDGILNSEKNMHHMNILMFGEAGHA